MGDFSKKPPVQAIKFKQISEDQFNEERKIEEKSNSKTEKQQDFNNLKKSLNEPNFTLEYTYPAVIFDRVCFSVDRSQQQSNFLNECLFRLRNCKGLCSNRIIDENANKVEILKSINLNVPYGSIFGLLGPSSCGKTTLLRCLVGLLKQNSGTIRLFGQASSKEINHQDANCCCGCLKTKNQTDFDRTKCKVPGSNVGYMPQDLGLYEDFTIEQLLTMFGRYMGMEDELIAARIKFMANFLDLPSVNREILTLSGGQKRRVSFAVACLHMPPLIILDEPTVGVDPLLRQSIWKYLRRLADEENKTIIITTHYIEEAAQADQVALMRAGEILIQDTPSRIMKSNGCKTLEEAFLKICNNVKQQNRKQINSRELQNRNKYVTSWPDDGVLKSDVVNDYAPAREVFDNHDLMVRQLKLKAQEKLALFDQLYSEKMSGLRGPVDDVNGPSQAIIKNKLPSVKKRNSYKLGNSTCHGENIDHEHRNSSGIKLFDRPGKRDILEKMRAFLRLAYALLYKNYRRNVNSLPLLAFQFLLPIIQMISFSLCVGGKPTSIGLGLVNFDQPSIYNSNPLHINETLASRTNDMDSDTIYLSDSYLSFLDTEMLSIKKYDDLQAALADVRKAKLWAVMEIGENFTQTILKRFDLENFYQLTPDVVKQSIIKLYPDRSNKVLDMICHRSLITSYRSFLMDQFEHFKQLPLVIKEPVFDIKPNLISNSIDGYTESIAAGLLASLTYIMAAGLTTFIMVVERGNGILERTYTSGINPIAYLLAHAAFRSFVMMLQIALVMILTFYVLKQPLVGSIILAYLMLMTLNLTGIAYGLLISSLVTDQNGAALTIVSSLVVKITMSGILWPFEAIPQWLRLICYCQPLTMPVQALKAITLKGAGLQDKAVYLGFSVSIGYLIIFLTIAARRFKFYQH